MARNVEEILKEQLGNLIFQLSIVQSQIETLREENEQLKSKSEKVE